MFVLLQLPIWALYAICNQTNDGWIQKIKSAFKPSMSWGPNGIENCKLFCKYQYFKLIIFITVKQYKEYSKLNNLENDGYNLNILQKMKRNIFG